MLLREMEVKTGAEEEMKKADADGRFRNYHEAKDMLRACKTGKLLVIPFYFSIINLYYLVQFTSNRSAEAQILR